MRPFQLLQPTQWEVIDQMALVGKSKGGLKSGYPDLLMDMACNGYHGLRIEMKKYSKLAMPSAEQIEWLNRLSKQGYLAVLC
jgi:hypothetical protein